MDRGMDRSKNTKEEMIYFWKGMGYKNRSDVKVDKVIFFLLWLICTCTALWIVYCSHLRVYSGVCLSLSRKLSWEQTVKQAGSIPLRAIGSVLESMLTCLIGNRLSSILGSELRVYFGVSWELNWKLKSIRLGVQYWEKYQAYSWVG